ncbi:MAG TPA: hypothetical protein VKR06_13090 [Ktedonosporobacter sp.]|nr:hypothetical protein [Ktedonosporobacter sp.]
MSQSTNNLVNFLKVRGVLLTGLALLLILSSIGLFFFAQTDHTVAANVQATAGIEMKTISTRYVATNSARAGATASIQAQTTATAQANATATAEVTAATATAFVSGNPYPPHNGTLALDDSLHNNSSNSWEDYTSSDGSVSCRFIGGAYHSKVTSSQQHVFNFCPAFSTDFSNFVFQVQMTIVSGEGGGIDFCQDPAKGNGYYFFVYQDGSYNLVSFNNNKFGSEITSVGTSSAIKTGTNQSNLIAVVVRGGTFELYVNNQHIATAHDTTYSHGMIAVHSYEFDSPADVTFSNAKVWTL